MPIIRQKWLKIVDSGGLSCFNICEDLKMIIGRKDQINLLNQTLESDKSEFVVVYGRRRVGKTFLIDEFFNGNYAFYATGVVERNQKNQLKVFERFLLKYGHNKNKTPSDWYEAFDLLINILESDNVNREISSNKRIVFLDELPWMDTPKSNFKSALDYFWNSYASKHKDIVLIVCGSATSWILNNLLNSKTGFYNRVTKKILLEPFTLKETYEYLLSKGFQYTKQTVIDAYMVFGGVPFYLEMLSPRLSLDQNIEKLCFEEKGDLHYELNNLFKSLFKNHNKHLEVILSLSKVKSGITRQQIIEKTKINGQTLTDILLELEQCSFIRKFSNFTMQKNGSFYQIIDPFILFSLKFDFANKKISWLSFINSSGYYSWCGLAFEKVCLNNINSIKMALGISSIETEVFSWRSKNSETGAQIDLVIDRGDRTINICEMKHSISAFEIDKKYAENLLNKRAVFINETKTNKSVQISLFTVNGLKKNQYSNIVQNSFDCDSLFLI